MNPFSLGFGLRGLVWFWGKSATFIILVGVLWGLPTVLGSHSTAAKAEDQDWQDEPSDDWELQTEQDVLPSEAAVTEDVEAEESWSIDSSDSVSDDSFTMNQVDSSEVSQDDSLDSNPDEAIESPDEADRSLNPDGAATGKRPTAPPPEPTEWIAAWVSDLRQSDDKWIQVILSEQRLVAWEGDTVVFSAPVSTGRAGDWTPTGVYNVETKYKTAEMQGDGYDMPNVPYVMYFFGSYAIHGAYWHHNFGTPVSRGCINLDDTQAAWLFYWASVGTPVVVQQ